MLHYGRDMLRLTAERPSSPAEAVNRAIQAHMELVRIHPFQDGNGKTARFMMDVILMRDVIGTKRGLIMPASMRDKYMNAVQAHRVGKPAQFESLVLNLLELTLRRGERLRHR